MVEATMLLLFYIPAAVVTWPTGARLQHPLARGRRDVGDSGATR